MKNFGALARALSSTILLLVNATTALAQDKPSLPAPGGQRPGLSQDAIDNALAQAPGLLRRARPQNLSKTRPKAPFDVTGTWFIDLRKAFGDLQVRSAVSGVPAKPGSRR